jgi:hypothetical protein
MSTDTLADWMRTLNSRFDSVHGVAVVHSEDNTNHHLEPVTDFDFNRVDLDLAGDDEAAESQHSISDLSSALVRILHWIVQRSTFGQRLDRASTYGCGRC